MLNETLILAYILTIKTYFMSRTYNPNPRIVQITLKDNPNVNFYLCMMDVPNPPEGNEPMTDSDFGNGIQLTDKGVDQPILWYNCSQVFSLDDTPETVGENFETRTFRIFVQSASKPLITTLMVSDVAGKVKTGTIPPRPIEAPVIPAADAATPAPQLNKCRPLVIKNSSIENRFIICVVANLSSSDTVNYKSMMDNQWTNSPSTKPAMDTTDNPLHCIPVVDTLPPALNVIPMFGYVEGRINYIVSATLYDSSGRNSISGSVCNYYDPNDKTNPATNLYLSTTNTI